MGLPGAPTFTVSAGPPEMPGGLRVTVTLPVCAEFWVLVAVTATVAGAGGFTLDPNVLWHRLRGEGTNHELVVVASEPAFTNAVNSAATELASHTADASVAIQGTAAVVTDGSQGVAVDATAARDDILAHWPTTLPIALTAVADHVDGLLAKYAAKAPDDVIVTSRLRQDAKLFALPTL